MSDKPIRPVKLVFTRLFDRIDTLEAQNKALLELLIQVMEFQNDSSYIKREMFDYQQFIKELKRIQKIKIEIKNDE